MLTIKQINEVINQGESLLFVAQSYSDVAAAKLKRIRRGIEKNRDFLNEIVSVYATVKLVSAQRNITISSTSSMLDTASRFFPFGRHPGTKIKMSEKTINIVLTSNYRFYGNLEYDLLTFFVQNSQRFKAETIVVGKTGDLFFKTNGFTRYAPLIFTNDLPSLGELKVLIEKTKDFDRVLVYHSKFQSVLRQTPAVRDIKEAQFEVSIPRKKIDYIFEPEIDKMLAFFDSQVSTLLLEQTFLEAELARTAARLIAMNDAEDKAGEFIQQQRKSLAGAKRSAFNIDLLENIAGSVGARRAIYFGSAEPRSSDRG